MKTVLFICHGNICRSTMAEFLFRDLAEKSGRGEEFLVFSRATSTEELGNPVHPGTRRILDRLGIFCGSKRAEQVTKKDLDRADLVIVMDENNRRNLRPFLSEENAKKVHKLTDYFAPGRDVADPWYTGDFESTFRDIDAGCRALLELI